jgi:hypothetical protein
MSDKPVLINLDNEHRIVTDPYNFMLEKHEKVINRKTKEESKKWTVKSFHSCFEHAIHKYVEEVIREKDTTDIYKLVRELRSLREHITKVCNELNIKYPINLHKKEGTS